MTDALAADITEIRDLVEKWVIFSDSGDWERFARVWHDDGWMTATWLQASAADFIKGRREGFDRGISIIHFLGGFTCDVVGGRAVSPLCTPTAAELVEARKSFSFPRSKPD